MAQSQRAETKRAEECALKSASDEAKSALEAGRRKNYAKAKAEEEVKEGHRKLERLQQVTRSHTCKSGCVLFSVVCVNTN